MVLNRGDRLCSAGINIVKEECLNLVIFCLTGKYNISCWLGGTVILLGYYIGAFDTHPDETITPHPTLNPFNKPHKG